MGLVDAALSRLAPRGPEKALTPASATAGRGWIPLVMEPFTGAWQRNKELRAETVLAYHAVFACVSLIAGDISKLMPRLVKKDSAGIWTEIDNKDYGVIVTPNSWQNRIQFYANWVMSMLTRGNAYILKERGANRKVKALYVLCPDLVLPLVSTSGDVYYQLSQDNLAGLQAASVVVPASEIIHDRFNCLFHPLVGLSPLFACNLSAWLGQNIQLNGASFFKNMSRPGGILTAPGAISDETALRLKTDWEANFGGSNIGKVAVLGDDLKYVTMTNTAVEAQMVEQLKLSAEIVCSTFHVPAYKVIGNAPSYNNIEALDQQYYSQTLQILIEQIELCLDEGLEIAEGSGVEFDLDGLFRMDQLTLVKTLTEGIKGLYTVNEARRRVNLKSVKGGDSVYLQQQNYSLEALAKRDAQDDPFASAQRRATDPANQQDEPPPADPADASKALAAALEMLDQEDA